MKPKTNNGHLKLYVLAALLLVGLAAVVVYFQLKPPTDNFEPKYQQLPQSESNTNDGISQADDTTKTQQDNQLPQTSEEVTTSSSGSIQINELGQSKGFVNVSVSTSDFSVIRCVYTFTSEGAKPVVRESPSCTSLSIPEIEFEKIGTYTLTATAYSQNSKISTSRDISIR